MLSRLVGLMNASDLLLSARTVTAEEAERMGPSEYCPPTDLSPPFFAIASDLR